MEKKENRGEVEEEKVNEKGLKGRDLIYNELDGKIPQKKISQMQGLSHSREEKGK